MRKCNSFFSQLLKRIEHLEAKNLLKKVEIQKENGKASVGYEFQHRHICLKF